MVKMRSENNPKIVWEYYFENMCLDGNPKVAALLYNGICRLLVKEDRKEHYTETYNNFSTCRVSYALEKELCEKNGNSYDSSSESLKHRLIEGCKIIEEDFLEQFENKDVK